MRDLITAIASIFAVSGKILTRIRNFVLNTLFLLLIVVIIFALFSDSKPKMPAKALLKIDITGNIVEEKKVTGSLERLVGNSLNFDESDPETLLQDILDIINKSKDDSRIVGLILGLKDLEQAGLDQLRAIGQALDSFKASGKKIVAAEDFYSQAQYYLASHANTVFLHPLGAVDLHGFGVFRLYFQEALEKLKINYHIFKIGEYKTALEPITRNDMSVEDREQNRQWLSALWQIFIDDIARSRDLKPDTIIDYTHYIDKMLQATHGDTAQLALNTRLIDRIATREDVKKHLSVLLQKRVTEADIIRGTSYLRHVGGKSYRPQNSDRPKIGLIIAEGNILPGKQPPGIIGGDSLATLIREARQDNDIKALVVRVNSPGGSAHAAEIIRQELLATQKEGKPVVISMGSVAASGGYWLAANADEIWASPVTVTGSIGVFGAFPTFENSLESLGIHSDGVGTTPLAAGFTMVQPIPIQLQNAIQLSIRHSYETFIELVAEGRKLDLDEVEKLAQGRIYDGKRAHELGLVDSLGSLEDALQSAAKLADLQDYDTQWLQPTTTIRDQFMQLLTTAAKAATGRFGSSHHTLPVDRIDKLFAPLKNLLQLKDPQHVYAYRHLDLIL